MFSQHCVNTGEKSKMAKMANLELLNAKKNTCSKRTLYTTMYSKLTLTMQVTEYGVFIGGFKNVRLILSSNPPRKQNVKCIRKRIENNSFHCQVTDEMLFTYSLSASSFSYSSAKQHRTKKWIEEGYRYDQRYAVAFVSRKTKLGLFSLEKKRY